MLGLSCKSCWCLLLWLVLVVCLRVLILSFYPSPCRSCQPGPAVQVVYQKVPGSVVPVHSPQAAPAWATGELPPVSITLTAFRLEKKEEQMAVYSKIIISTKKKKINGIIYCLLWLPNISCCVTVKIENIFSQAVNGIVDTVPHNLFPRQLTPAWEVLVWRQLTWHVFVDAYAHIHSPTYTQRFLLHLGLYLFVQYLCSFFPLSIQSLCENQSSGYFSSIGMWKWNLSVMNIKCIQYTAHLLLALILDPFISFLLSTGALLISSGLWLSRHCTSLSTAIPYANKSCPWRYKQCYESKCRGFE